LLDDADAAAQRTTLGLGTLATQSGTFSGTSSGTNTGDQTITLTGDVTGSGTGSFAATLANSGVAAGTYNNAATAVRPFTVDAKGRVTGIGTAVTITPAFSSITSKPTTLSGYGITDAPTLSGSNALTGANTFTNTTGQIFRQAATQDGVLLRGRAGGTTSLTVEIVPTTLTASRTLTAPNVSGTIITTGDTDTVTNTMLAGSIANAKLANSTISGVALGGTLSTLTLGTGLSGASYNGSAAITAAVSYGTTAGTACQGNDSRLSDARTPTAHTHGNISNAGAIGSTANLPIITTTSGVLTTGSFGTAASTFCQGNDSRLSDTRNTTNSLTAGSFLTGSTFNGSAAVTFAVDATSANTASKVVARDASGNFSAGTISATLTGNAGTATTLQTARTINGTSFNGSANITTANWGTARTLTIGSTGKSVNGAAAVSWSLSEIGALPAAGGTLTGNLDNTGTGYIRVAVGTTAQRPASPQAGWIRFNTSRGCFEGYTGSQWVNMSPLNMDDVGATA
jgi:hypothetical protein